MPLANNAATSAIVPTLDHSQPNNNYLMVTVFQPQLPSPRPDKIQWATLSKYAMEALLHGTLLHRVDRLYLIDYKFNFIYK